METVFDPNLNLHLPIYPPREATRLALEVYKFADDSGQVIDWKSGQIEIIDCIVNRSSPDALKRVETMAATQYGKSIAVAAGILIRENTRPEGWAIVAGTTEKARIIMEYAIMMALNNDFIRSQLTPDTPLDRLRMKRSAERLTFRRKGEIRVYSAEARLMAETSKSLMGFGAPNVVEDEAALVPDPLQATVMRMLGGHADNFLIKVGNPFTRGHFWRTWKDGTYHRIFIDYERGLREGRFTPDFIEEMRKEAMFDILYECRFPESDKMDTKGWLPLLTEAEITRAFVEEDPPFGEKRLGCDVAGGGRNFSVVVHRGYNVAHKIYKRTEPDTMLFAGNVILFMSNLGVKSESVFIDQVGIGKGGYDRLREQRSGIVGVNGGFEPTDKVRFMNLRAEMYWRTRQWILQGGKLKRDDDWYQLTEIKYRVVDSSGRIQIMSKEEMLREGIDSPDVADALAMTFAKAEVPLAYQQQATVNRQAIVTPESLDPYAR